MMSHDEMMPSLSSWTLLLAATLTCSMVLSCSVISEIVSSPPPVIPQEGDAPRCPLVARFLVAPLELFILILSYY